MSVRPLRFTANEGVKSAISVVIFICVSLADDAPSEDSVRDVTWRPKMAHDGAAKDAPSHANIQI